MDGAAALDGEVFGRRFRWWIVVCGNGLGAFLVVGLLVVNSLGLAEMPRVVRGLLLLSYVLSWIVGTNVDLSAQRSAYFESPVGPIPRWAFFIVLAITIIGGLLIVSRDDRYFAATLVAFFGLNVLSWCLFQMRVKLAASQARLAVLKEHPERIPLFDAVQHYVTGDWQWCRFAAMSIAIAAAVTTSFSITAREITATQLHELVPTWPIQAISYYVPVVCLAAFMLIAETWVWLMRFGVRQKQQQLALDTAASADDGRSASVSEPGKSKRKNDRRSHAPSTRLTWPRYLWAGHAAGIGLSSKILLGSDALHHDYAKYCGFIFLLGLILAVLSFVSLTIVHDSGVVSHLPLSQVQRENSRAARKAWLDFGMSTLLLLVGLAIVATSLWLS